MNIGAQAIGAIGLNTSIIGLRNSLSGLMNPKNNPKGTAITTARANPLRNVPKLFDRYVDKDAPVRGSPSFSNDMNASHVSIGVGNAVMLAMIATNHQTITNVVKDAAAIIADLANL